MMQKMPDNIETRNSCKSFRNKELVKNVRSEAKFLKRWEKRLSTQEQNVTNVKIKVI